MEQLLDKSRDGEKPRELPPEKGDPGCKGPAAEIGGGAASNSGSSKPGSPSVSPTGGNVEQKRTPEVTSQGVQTSGPGAKQEREDREEKKDE